tara:strand:+ start:419 stop:1270 length:852 start_codon:yes stop_codon:yes gene_type:complete
MKSNILKLSLAAAAALAFSISSSYAQTIDGSTVYLGWSDFDVSVAGNNNSKIQELTPNETGGGFLSGIVGVGASGNGYGAKGRFANNVTGVNDSTLGGLTDGPDMSSTNNLAVKFTTLGGFHRLDFLIKNESLTNDFVLDSIHFDNRNPNAASNNAFTIQYLANNGTSNLQNMGTGANVSNLAFIAGSSATEGVSSALGNNSHDISIAANIAGNQAGVKLAAGDQASFRITFIGSSLSDASKQNQLDNLGFSGSFAVPEPSSYALLAGLFACTYMMARRRAVS